MPESATDLLPEYKRVTELAIEYFKQPTWTPAFAVLFVCGIEPLVGCRAIPKRGMQVRRASVRATPVQLHRAKRLLERWREDHTDEDDPNVRPPSRVAPLDFFEWCEDACRANLTKPELLDHVLGLINVPSESDPLPPVPLDFLERAEALDHYKRVEFERAVSAARLAAQVTVSASATVRTVRRSGSHGKVCPLEAEILEARSLAPPHQRGDAAAVAAVMLRFAHDGAHPKLERSTSERIYYVKDGVTTEYTARALQQFLNRRPL